jgi:cell wall-associated NlpC family hydrolase
MKKQLIALATMGAIFAGCSSSATAAQTPAQTSAPQATVKTSPDFTNIIWQDAQEHRMAKVVRQLKKRIGKTWYVFSGSTPRGCDCSGLTRWAYAQIGVDIPHSANKQARAGIRVVSPSIGDLVLFGYPGTNTFFHASIYIGSNKVIHAGFKRGQTTSILDLESASVKNTKIRFVRVSANG